MPGALDRPTVLVSKLPQVMVQNHRVERATMHVIDIEGRVHLPDHALKGTPAILVGDSWPIGVYPTTNSRIRERLAQALILDFMCAALMASKLGRMADFDEHDPCPKFYP